MEELADLCTYIGNVNGLESYRPPSLTDRDSVFDRSIAPRADNHRRKRLLRWLGIASDGRKPDELALEAGLGLGPQLFHRANVLARDRPSTRKIYAENLTLIAQPPGADPEQKTAARVMVESCDFLGKQDRI